MLKRRKGGPELRKLLVLSYLFLMLLPLQTLAESAKRIDLQTLVDSANAKYQRGLYQDAARQFAQAFEISGDANYLYDAAISFQQIQKWALFLVQGI